jgi:aspartyl/asparaginyl beta-hydroxylase (cupin superfamily)
VIDQGPFFSSEDYPELATLTTAWRDIRAEALAAVPSMTFVRDNRVAAWTWGVLPFRVEADDRQVITDEQCVANRAVAPRTVGLVEALGVPVEAFSFSLLAAGATIAEHRHHEPFVTAALCLSGEGATIRVGGETRSYVDGQWILFDYTQPHSVTNKGPEPRVVLLVLVRSLA